MEPLAGVPPPSVAPDAGPALALRRFMLRRGWPGLALSVSIAATVRTHWFFIRPYATPMGFDEGYIAALAQRLVLGDWLPYVDGVSQRGPVTYWLCALVMRLGGLYSWMPLRLLSLGLALSAVVLVFLLGLELFSPFVAAVAVLVVAYFSNYELNPWDGVGYNGEIATMPLLLLSALLVARVQNRGEDPARAIVPRARSAGLLVAGALVAVAALTKQIALIHAIPAGLWLLLGPRGEASPPVGVRPWIVARGPDVARLVAGFAGPFLLTALVYAFSGHLREFVYYYQRYGRDVYMAPVTWKYARESTNVQLNHYSLGLAVFTLVTLFALARAVREALEAPRGEGPAFATRLGRALGRARAASPILFVLLHFFGAVAGATFPFRFFGHYLLEVYPFFGLMAGYAVSRTFDATDDDGTPSGLGTAVVVLGGLLLLVVADAALRRNVVWRRGPERWDRWYQDPQTDPIVRYVEKTTSPSDTIFVWGFRSEVHVSAGRPPASRFVYSIYPSGFVPWFHASLEVEAKRAVPGSRELLLDDLEESQPELVIDAGSTMYDRYMRDIPVFRAYLDAHYCPMGTVDGEPIYRRRRADTCPAPDAPP